MNTVDRLAKQIRNNEPISGPLSLLLHTVSFGQRLGMRLRFCKRSVRVPAYVISFGNLTAGGTGKTPAVIERARRECQAGNQVAVITRGYGARRSKGPVIHEPGEQTTALFERMGDEAALIAKCVPAVWVVRYPDRVAAAEVANRRGCTVLILDDGFQAVSLARDENIVLIDATNPFGNGHILPRGILREPLASLCRATEIIVTRCDQAPEALPAIEATLRKHAPNIPVYYRIHRAVGLRKLSDDSEIPLTFLKDTHVRAVCAIGNPDSFAVTLKNLGANLVEMHCLADHASIPLSLFNGKYPVVITEKDAIRITDKNLPNVYVLCVSLAPYACDTSASMSR